MLTNSNDAALSEYQKFKTLHPDDPTDFESFAQHFNSLQPAPESKGVWKTVNDTIDKAFDYTPDPTIIASPRTVGGTVGEAVGSGFDKLVGTHIAPTLKSIGEETPRMVTEGLLTAVQPEIGAPAILSRLATAAKIAGYGSAFTRGTAEADGNPVGGAIAAGSLGLGNVLIPKAGDAAERGLIRLLEKSTPDFVPGDIIAPAPQLVQKGLGGIANAGAGAATATGINEATRQAALTVAPEDQRTPGDRNPFTQENIAGNVAGAAFFAPQIIDSVRKGGPILSPKQTKGAYDFYKAQENLAKPAIEAGTASPIGSRQDALFHILEQSIENRKNYLEDGKTDEVARLDKTIEDAYTEIVSGRYSPVSEENKDRLKAAVDDVVKFQPPDTPQKFGEYD